MVYTKHSFSLYHPYLCPPPYKIWKETSYGVCFIMAVLFLSSNEVCFWVFDGQKDAVSTSHSSQPNTVEYDMAMDWVLLQEKSEFSRKMLYKVLNIFRTSL